MRDDSSAISVARCLNLASRISLARLFVSSNHSQDLLRQKKSSASVLSTIKVETNIVPEFSPRTIRVVQLVFVLFLLCTCSIKVCHETRSLTHLKTF
jgi:hypothetical protein